MLRALLLTWFGAQSAFAAVDVQKAPDQTTYQFSIDGVDFNDVDVDGVAFTKATLRGVDGYDAVYYNEGKPAVPVIRFYVDGDGAIEFPAVPPAFSARVLYSPHRALPALAPVPKIPGAKPHLTLDRATYDGNAPIPTGDNQIDTLGKVGGVTRRLVTLNPVHYNPATGAWTIAQKLKVVVHVPVRAVTPATAGETLAVVVGDGLAASKALAQYLDGKRQMGYAIRTIVAKKTATTPADIRGQLQALLANAAAPLKWVLIVGSNDDVPAYPSTTITGVTDHYYRSLSSANYDDAVGVADVGVGRIAVSTEADLETVLAKNSRYAAARFAGQDWIHKAAWIASDDPGHWQIAEGSFNYTIDKYTKALGWLGDFPAAPESGGDELYAITDKADTAAVLNVLHEGRGFVNYGGHGGPDEWVGPQLTMDDLTKLDNHDALPVVVANACDTGDLTTNSFGAAWQKHPYGAVMYWGSMDSTYWDEDDVLQRAMYDALFRDRQLGFTGFTQAAQAEVWRHYGGAGLSKYYWETYVTYADPTMRLRDVPAALPLLDSVHDSATGVLTVTVKNAAGAVVPGARVAVATGEAVAPVAYTDAKGQAAIAVKAGAPSVKVMVEGDGLTPVITDRSLATLSR